jgi:hypothetical protein
LILQPAKPSIFTSVNQKLKIMKQLFVLFFTLIYAHTFSQGLWGKIEGNGNIMKEKRQMSDFTEIASSGSMSVAVSYGSSNEIEVEGDENILPYIITEVKNNRLTIRTKNVSFNTKNKITVYVSLTKLTGVSLSGSGNITGNGKFENNETTTFRVSGSGSIRMGFDKINKADIIVSGSGNITLSGSASFVDVTISGSGNANCFDLVCDDVKARISGSGNIKIFADKSVDASISGSGSVHYKGSAANIQQKTSGSGKVVKE